MCNPWLVRKCLLVIFSFLTGKEFSNVFKNFCTKAEYKMSADMCSAGSTISLQSILNLKCVKNKVVLHICDCCMLSASVLISIE